VREIITLEMRDLEIAHEVLAEVFAEDPEPIPAWEEGNRSLLETCCACSEVEAFGVQKYPDIPAKVAKIFYSATKLHAFPNGNKRFAFVLTLQFLLLNNMRLTLDPGLGAELAKHVADSDPQSERGHPDRMVAMLSELFCEFTEPREEPN